MFCDGVNLLCVMRRSWRYAAALTVVGRNPLVLYLLQALLVLVLRVLLHLYPQCSDSVLCSLIAFFIVYGCCYVVALALYSRGKVIKI